MELVLLLLATIFFALFQLGEFQDLETILRVAPAQLIGDPTILSRFEREVKATAMLSHPNTVRIYDYGIADDGTFYYTMEYLPGLTLHELVQDHGPLLPERAVHMLRQACSALAEAHGKGLMRSPRAGHLAKST
jgi:serine/threonine protein kinase